MTTLTQTDTTTATRTLVLSWSGLLSLVYSRRIMRQDLRNALFYFGCIREHVFDDGVGGEQGEMLYYYNEDPEGVSEIYRMLCVIIRVAEAEGRVVWRELDGHKSFTQLNGFLAGHGLSPIWPADGHTRRNYNHGAVHQTVADQDLPYRVISNSRHI